jgi:hypothetical protein
MRREIGSEFWDVPLTGQQNNLFPESTQWFLSGRSALYAIIAELGAARSVSLPSWCCDSMVKPFVDGGMEVHFYPVYWQDGLIQEINAVSDVLFLMDYFGYSTPSTDLSNYRGAVIRDVTHSLFSSTFSDADYYFGSLRKWCGVWTGGYAWARDGHKLKVERTDDNGYILLREKAMQMKSSYIHGQGIMDKGYLRVFDEAEEILEDMGIASATDRDVSLAKKLDVEGIRKRRRANAALLMDAFSDWLLFPILTDTACPMFVPVLVPDGKRDKLRKYLIQNEIYCPIHWPVSQYHVLEEKTGYIYQNELSLVCDQRYTEEDMHRLIDTVSLFWKEA